MFTSQRFILSPECNVLSIFKSKSYILTDWKNIIVQHSTYLLLLICISGLTQWTTCEVNHDYYSIRGP